MNTYHVVLVKCCATVDSPPFPGDLQFFQKSMESAGIRYDVQAWDDPDVKWERYTHVIITSVIEYHCNIDQFLKWVSDMKVLMMNRSTKMWNSPEVIVWNHNKKYLLELQAKNIQIPATLLVEDVKEDLSLWLERRLGMFERNGRVVVKDIIGAAGTSVWVSNLIRTKDGTYAMPPSDLKRLSQQIQVSNGVLIQEYLPTILDEGEWSLIYFNNMFSHAVLKKPSGYSCDKLEIRVHCTYGGTFQPVEQKHVPLEVLQFGDRVMSLFSEPLLHARVDILNSQDGEPCLLEFEVLDPCLYQTEAIHGEQYLKALLNISN